MKPEDAANLASVRLAFTVSADKPLKDVESLKSTSGGTGLNALTGADAIDFGLALHGKGSSALAEIRQVGGTAYARVDVDGLAGLVGEDASELRSMESELPPELKVFKEALQGKWISFDSKLMEQFTNDLGGQAGAKPSAAPSVDADTQRKLLDALGSVLSRDVTFEEKGRQGDADRILISAPARTLVRDLEKALTPLAKQFPGLDKELPTSSLNEIPDRQVSAELLIKDGVITSIGFDFAQLVPKATSDDHMVVKLSLSREAAAVQAPTGAVALTKKDLDGMMGMMVAGADETGFDFEEDDLAAQS
ncbi:hypothetical protein [Peterkaempfera bronchialis]|uniref:hypothetical protein n=1 Tax=Peterkaempfera bronchialis TaxID=2126346 RepID=UPI000DADC8FB|nr:hypothetical protein [Peterkaempfera bronchialis]